MQHVLRVRINSRK